MSVDTCTNGNFLLCTLTIPMNQSIRLNDKNGNPVSAWNYNVYIVGVCIANSNFLGGSGVYFTVDVNNNYYCNCYWATMSIIVLCIPNNLFDSNENYILNGNGNPLYLGNTISKNYSVKVDNDPRPRSGDLPTDSMQGVPMLTGWDISSYLGGTYWMCCYLNPGNLSFNSDLGYNTYPSPQYTIGYSNGVVTCNYSFLHPILFNDIGISCNGINSQIIVESAWGGDSNAIMDYNYYRIDNHWSFLRYYKTKYSSDDYIVVIQGFQCGLGNNGHLYNYCYAFLDNNQIWNIAIESFYSWYGSCYYLAIPKFLFNNANGYDLSKFNTIPKNPNEPNQSSQITTTPYFVDFNISYN